MQEWLLITTIHLLTAASPGPDFAMVTQQTISHGKKAGILCSLGIALGLSIHFAYSALGFATIIANSITTLWIIKILGGSYLIYLGIKGLLAKPLSAELNSNPSKSPSHRNVMRGFWCNVLNPKAPIYFVSLFAAVLSPDMPASMLVFYGLWIMFLQFAWFSLVTLLLSSSPVSKRFKKIGHWIERIVGGAMLLLGIKLITSKPS